MAKNMDRVTAILRGQRTVFLETGSLKQLIANPEGLPAS